MDLQLPMQSLPITTNVVEFESRSKRGVQHYVIKFVSDLRQFGGFLRHNISEILLKVALSTIKQQKTNNRSGRYVRHYVIKIVSDLRQVGGFLRFPPPIKLTATI